MIPRDYITRWRARAPWAIDAQVEQDLVISRALVELFGVPSLASRLAFRGVGDPGERRAWEASQPRVRPSLSSQVGPRQFL